MGLAALVRVLGLDYGLPPGYHPDEPRIVARAVRVLQGDPDPRFFNWPSLYIYVIAGVYELVFGARGAAAAMSGDGAALYLVARATTACLGAATVGVLYLLAAELGGATVGLLAAAFLAVDVLHVHDSQYVTTDVPLAFLVTLGTLLTVRYARGGRPWTALASGLVVGLAASMKYPGGLLVVPLVLAAWWRLRAEPGARAFRAGAWRLGGALAAATLGFVLGTPYALLTPRAFVLGLLDEVGEIHTVQYGNEGDWPAPLFHLAHSLPEAMGLPLLALAVGGIVLALHRRRPIDLIVLAFPLPYFVIISTWSSRFERYAMPLLPFLALAAAACLAALVWGVAGRAGWRPRTAAVALGLAVVVVGGPQVARLSRFHTLLTRPDTREVAAAWIEREVPAGSSIAMEAYSPALPVMGAVGGGHGYRIARLESYDLDRLLRERVDYVVVSGFVVDRNVRACDRYPATCRFYGDLERRARLVLDVRPSATDLPFWMGDKYSPLTRLSERERPGPRVRVYRLPEPAS